MKKGEITKLPIEFYNRSFVFRKVKNLDNLSLSLNYFVQAFSAIFSDQINKILISPSGDLIQQNTFNSFVEFFTSFYQTLFFDKYSSVPLEIDEYVYNHEKYDVLFKISLNKKLDYLVIDILSFKNHKLTKELLKKIKETYELLNDMHFDTNKTNLVSLSLDKYLNYFASSNSTTGDFKKLKERYKSVLAFNFKTNTQKSLVSKMLKFYKNDYKIVPFAYNGFWRKIWFNLFSDLKKNKKHVHAIFNWQKNNTFQTWFKINNKFELIESSDLALIYLNFFFEELKRSHEDLSEKYVVISHDSNYKLLKFLKQFKIKYYYFDEENHHSNINNPNCLFVYINNYFLSNTMSFKVFNNSYFLLCLIWMFNNYRNRNNLLTFKYKQLEDNFGITKTKIVEKAYQIDKLDNLIKAATKFINLKHKHNLINKINVFNDYEDKKLFLFKLLTSKNHAVILSYDFLKKKLVIQYQLCKQYEYESRNIILDFLLLKLEVRKILRISKKILKNSAQ
ncbi:MAG5620 family putative phospho-sugar mutase [Mycoplasmopsis iners]|uniref:MAG5620 family putative phospho-sugar mutase n=1 Tax=Mycoplasmopsis iners TaxID=76630 RepID=UPI0004960F10|nr:hypothetical protein [Mycoplasmopsis iners]